MPHLRALGWAALASAPALIATLAVVSTRPDAPGSLVTGALFVAWLAGTLAFFAALVHHRRGVRAARALAGLSAGVVALWSVFLVWLSAHLAS